MPRKSALQDRLQELNALRDGGIVTEDEYNARRAAILAGPPETPPQHREGCFGIFKWGFMGCLGMIAALFVVFVVIAIIAAAASSSDDNGTLASGEARSGFSGSTPPEADDDDVRASLTVGGWGEIAPEGNGDKRSRITILEISDPADSGNQFLTPDEGNRYWAVRVEVENVGSEQVTSLGWTLRDRDGFEYDESFAGDADVLIYHDLTPGSKRQGWIFFEIPQAAAVDWLRGDPNFLLANDLYFDAP